MLPTLLLTRPEPDSRAFLKKVVAALGHDIPHLVAPVLAIRPVATEPLTFEAAVLTSAHAARILGPALSGRQVWCVGAQTAEAASENGAMVVSVFPTAEALVANAKINDAVYFRGTHVSVDLARRFEIREQVIYRQDAVPLAPAAVSLLTGTERFVLPLFSRRSAELVLAAVENWSDRGHIIAISPAVAELAPKTARVTVAAEPDGQEMLAQVVRACQEDE